MIERTIVLRTLRLNILLAFLLLGFNSSQAQYVTIPDSGFNALLMGAFPNCFNDSGQLDTTCTQILNVTYLNTSYQSISSLEGAQYFKALDSLYCNSDTTLIYIPALAKSLRVLECRENALTSLPLLTDSLTRLACEFNLLDSLPSPLPKALRSLTCYNNNLTSLPVLPAGLNALFCSGNQLDSLPALPDSLVVLSCYSNKLKQLPVLDTLLVELLCSGNLLSALPAVLPASLLNLDCYSNNLSTLPALPAALQALSCNDNHLTSLPALPNTLTLINCSNNQLTSLPELPDSMFQLFVANNPNLKCLPQLNTIVDFEFTSTGIACLPDYGNIYFANPDTLPVCDSTNNPHGCLVINAVKEIVKPAFRLYPNPANGYVMIDADESVIGGTMRLFDNLGKMVISARLTGTSTKVITADLAAGLYLVLVSNPVGRTSVSKLVIQ
jgi:hypothetical protein